MGEEGAPQGAVRRRPWLIFMALSILLLALIRLFYALPEGDGLIHQARLENAGLSAIVVDNIAGEQRSGNGLASFVLDRYPGRNIFHTEAVGLNFEHVYNGKLRDRKIAQFTARQDPCILTASSPTEVALRWPAEGSTWGLDCEATFRLATPEAIDMEFSVTPREARFELGWVAFMWANYIGRALDRPIHFWGEDGDRRGWVTFGGEVGEDFEEGTVSASHTPKLTWEKDCWTLNIIEHPRKFFSEPFYYGLIDGDQNLETKGDTLAFVMMFDQKESIRFALWNFIKDEQRRIDPHSPAWDWHYVIQDPQVGQTYRYRARLLVTPFVSPEAVRKRYQDWARSLPK